MKNIKIILFILSTTYCSLSFAQSSDTVYYNIERNDPKNINNLYAYAMPLNIDFLISYINISYGFGAEYNHRDKLILGVDFRRSYTEKLNELLKGTSQDNYHSEKQGIVSGNVKNFTTYEFSAQFLLGGKLRVHNEKPVMNDGLNSTTYIKIKTKQFLALALRASYGYHQYNITNLSMNDMNFKYTAYKITNPSVLFDDIAGSTMYYMQFVSLGAGLYQKQDLKLSTNSYGVKDYSMITHYYFDVLIPTSQELTNMNVSDRSTGTSINYEANVDEHTIMTSYGFRAGMKFQSVSKLRKINSGAKFEIGFLPGPGTITNNFFISLGLDLNISFDTHK